MFQYANIDHETTNQGPTDKGTKDHGQKTKDRHPPLTLKPFILSTISHQPLTINHPPLTINH
jgi:hypothetical protein